MGTHHTRRRIEAPWSTLWQGRCSKKWEEDEEEEEEDTRNNTYHSRLGRQHRFRPQASGGTCTVCAGSPHRPTTVQSVRTPEECIGSVCMKAWNIQSCFRTAGKDTYTWATGACVLDHFQHVLCADNVELVEPAEVCEHITHPCCDLQTPAHSAVSSIVRAHTTHEPCARRVQRPALPVLHP